MRPSWRSWKLVASKTRTPRSLLSSKAVRWASVAASLDRMTPQIRCSRRWLAASIVRSLPSTTGSNRRVRPVRSLAQIVSVLMPVPTIRTRRAKRRRRSTGLNPSRISSMTLSQISSRRASQMASWPLRLRRKPPLTRTTAGKASMPAMDALTRRRLRSRQTSGRYSPMVAAVPAMVRARMAARMAPPRTSCEDASARGARSPGVVIMA